MTQKKDVGFDMPEVYRLALRFGRLKGAPEQKKPGEPWVCVIAGPWAMIFNMHKEVVTFGESKPVILPPYTVMFAYEGQPAVIANPTGARGVDDEELGVTEENLIDVLRMVIADEEIMASDPSARLAAAKGDGIKEPDLLIRCETETGEKPVSGAVAEDYQLIVVSTD